MDAVWATAWKGWRQSEQRESPVRGRENAVDPKGEGQGHRAQLAPAPPGCVAALWLPQSWGVRDTGAVSGPRAPGSEFH